MPATYAIRDWTRHFEPSQAKRNSGPLSWVAVPTKHDGRGFRRVMRLPNGPAIYAAWILMLQVAAKCPRRGILADEDGPLTADDLSIKTDCPAEHFQQAMEALTDPKIGWLTVDLTAGRPARPEGSHSETPPSALGSHSETPPSALGSHSETPPRPLIPPDQPDRTGPDQPDITNRTEENLRPVLSGKKQKRAKRWTPADITEADLRDNARLRKLHCALANFGIGGALPTEASELETFALAERALEIASRPREDGQPGNPVAFFLNDIKHGRADRLTNAQDERGRQRLLALRRGQPESVVDVIQAGADHLAASEISAGEDYE
jgi:hypothetical protein